jgi:membrane fusion protein (multidrug efflux system)
MAESEKNPAQWIQTNRKSLLITGPTLLIASVIIFYIFNHRYQSTDDAYIQTARVHISSNVSGQITEVAVKDNQRVKAGELLFKIDAQPFIISQQEAQANLANTKLQIQSLKSMYKQRQADEQLAKSTLIYQEKECKRQQKLSRAGIISQVQLEQTQHALSQAKSKLNAAHEASMSTLASLGGIANAPIEEHPSIQQAQAHLDKINLNLQYTSIKAPINGIVTKVEQLQVGSYIVASVPQFALISDNNIWIEANFKENQLTNLREGQSATFTIDTYPGETFKGTITSISPGTGSTFSLLPPENASGNWVKVTQRLPVRLSIDSASSNVPLPAGLSVTVEVDTRTSITFERK